MRVGAVFFGSTTYNRNETLIDGHNRYRIATEHGLTYDTVQKDFESREHALNWIISNQLGRRNLNPNQIAYLRGKRYETEKKLRGGDGTNQFTKEQMGQSDPIPIRTSQKLADEYGVAERTIRREGNFSKVVDILPEQKKEDVLTGKENFGRNETSKILKFDKPTQKKFIKEVESGTPIKEAVKKVDPEQKRNLFQITRSHHG